VAGAESGFESLALDRERFNPAQKESLSLSYTIPQAHNVSVAVYDADQGLVRTLVSHRMETLGTHTVTWDGLDDDGMLVPDEAYTFVLEASESAAYDPFTFATTTPRDVTLSRLDASSGLVSYTLPESGRVLFRLGIKDGPMLKTLVDWKPRQVGPNIESWDGMDEDHLIPLAGNKDFTHVLTYVPFPPLTVVTFGNTELSYREYKLKREKSRPRKVSRPVDASAGGTLETAGHTRGFAWQSEPRPTLSFPRFKTGEEIRLKRNQTLEVLVDVAPSDRAALLADQFEIVLFLDGHFVMEAERGRLPFNWKQDLNNITPGTHVLTTNVVSLAGPVGVKSAKIFVEP